MADDCYSFQTIVSSGNGIMVTCKGVKETRTGVPPENDEGSDDVFTLSEDDIHWLLDQVPGYRVFVMGDNFVFLMKESNKFIESRNLEVYGPYFGIEDVDRYVECKIEKVNKGTDEYNELFEISRKLTPQGQKLFSPPGQHIFSMANSDTVSLKELERITKPSANNEVANMSLPSNMDEDSDFPVQPDFDIVVGEGKDKKTIAGHKAILFSFMPEFENLVEEANEVCLPGLDPNAVQTVLDEFTTRKKVSMPIQGSYGYKLVEKVLNKFGLETKRASKKAKVEHPALVDHRWLDATFLVGKEEVKASRVVLASLNPVLCRILYGTGSISVDPAKPIVWDQFDPMAVRKVFSALIQRGKEEVEVPLDSVESTMALVDYLMETKMDLKLHYETPFLRGCESGQFYLYQTGFNNESLKFDG